MSEIALIVDMLRHEIEVNAEDIAKTTNMTQKEAEKFLLEEITKSLNE